MQAVDKLHTGNMSTVINLMQSLVETELDPIPRVKKYIEECETKAKSELGLEELISPKTKRLKGRLSRLLAFSAILTDTIVKSELKVILEIPEVIVGDEKKLNPEKFIGYLKDLELGGSIEPEIRSFTVGVQGAGKSSITQSIRKVDLSENVNTEFTEVMQENHVRLARGNKRIKVIKAEPNEGVHIIKWDEDRNDNSPSVPTQQRDTMLGDSQLVNIMDIGGHTEYFTITKVLIGGNTLFILTFDAGLYSSVEFHYRLVGTGIDTILDKSSNAVIALVANKVDRGKQYYTNEAKHKEKILTSVQKQINQRQRTRGGEAYLVGYVFEVSCMPGKFQPVIKDLGNVLSIDKKNGSKDLQDLKEIMAEIFLDFEAVEANDGSRSSVITMERETPLLWKKFHEELVRKETDLMKQPNSKRQPLTIMQATEIYQDLRKVYDDKNRGKKYGINLFEIEEIEEIDWMLNEMKAKINKEEPQQTGQGEMNRSAESGKEELAPQYSHPLEKSRIEDEREKLDHAQTSQTDIAAQKAEPINVHVPIETKESCLVTLNHLLKSGKVIQFNEMDDSKNYIFPKIAHYVFPSANTLIDSLKLLVHHQLEQFFHQSSSTWDCIDTNIDPSERMTHCTNIIKKGFLDQRLLDGIFEENMKKGKKIFGQEIVVTILQDLQIIIKHTEEKCQGWLIPTQIQNTISNVIKYPNSKEYVDIPPSTDNFLQLEYVCDIKGDEIAITGIGISHKMLANLIGLKYSLKIRMIKIN